MRILTRYVLREYLVPLFYCLTGFVSIYVLFELFGSFSRLLRAKLPLATVADYFCAYLAPYFEWLAPAALMLAALYTMWSFCRHSELIAMLASGVSFRAIAAPILAVSVLMGAFVFWVNDCYVPRRAQWARQMKTCQFDLRQLTREDKLVYPNPEENRTWTVSRILDAEARHLEDVRITVDREGGGARLMTVSAGRADYLDGEWWLTDPKVQHFDLRGAEVATPTPGLDAIPFRPFADFREKPADFLSQNREWAYNSIRDRLRFVRTHPDLSEKDVRGKRYDIWAKILSPLACVVITLLAIPAGVSTGRQSVFRGILAALGQFFAFYGCIIGGMVAANVGWLPPAVAAVAPYVVFLALGVMSFRRQR